MELVDFNKELLFRLLEHKYKYFVCSLINERIKSTQEATIILLTPIRNMFEGFNLLPSINMSSYLMDSDEIMDDLIKSAPENRNIRFCISKQYSF